MQEYLKPESIKQKQDIFKMRTRMIDIKENMKGNHFNFDCDTCKLKGIRRKRTQRHVYKCIQLNKRKRTIKSKEIFGRGTKGVRKTPGVRSGAFPAYSAVPKSPELG